MDKLTPEQAYEKIKDDPRNWESDPYAVWFFNKEGLLCERINGLLTAPEVVCHSSFVRPGKKIDPWRDLREEASVTVDPPVSMGALCLCGKMYSKRIAVDACIARDHREVKRGRIGQSPIPLWWG